ncbi:MAG: 3'(2'),5'-bisphosphate nucleotidase [Cytophagales bacterium]|nr:MAG: 3'(2'),5'-bisphosphate nucleotidase [Cytophagales bacterium]TAF59471.1 MAG: 3'(2'),5'-bisphosphate nucleotidase [Cytophagales bacterium]
MINPQQLIAPLAEAAHAIMKVYNTADFKSVTSYKEDLSPLTEADKASHRIITSYLQKNHEHMPILSEEGQISSYEERKSWKDYWLLDPLDGTKEFLKRTGHFSINLSLMSGSEPVAAWIYVPVENICYWAVRGMGAFKTNATNDTIPIQVRKHSLQPKPQVVILSSASHASPEEEPYYRSFEVQKIIKMGSAIKFGLLAEGKGDFYVRFRPTMEWDTAAGQLIVEEAGGELLGLDGQRFTYNRASLYNKGFVCKAIFEP